MELLLDNAIGMDSNLMFLMTGDERMMSMYDRMNLACRPDPRAEKQRLVWHLFQRIKDFEVRIIHSVYRKHCRRNYTG